MFKLTMPAGLIPDGCEVTKPRGERPYTVFSHVHIRCYSGTGHDPDHPSPSPEDRKFLFSRNEVLIVQSDQLLTVKLNNVDKLLSFAEDLKIHIDLP